VDLKKKIETQQQNAQRGEGREREKRIALIKEEPPAQSQRRKVAEQTRATKGQLQGRKGKLRAGAGPLINVISRRWEER